LPPGRYTLQASLVGFAVHLQQVTVTAGKTETIEIKLREQPNKLGEVVVTGNMRETYVKESPVPVEVYTASYLQKNPVPAVFEALERINGVQPQVNCNV